MKTINKMELNTRILFVFFAAILLLSVCHFFVYGQLLSNLEKEEEAVNAERMNTAAVKLDVAFRDIKDSYMEMLSATPYKYQGSSAPEPYERAEMIQASKDTVGSCRYIHGYLIQFASTSRVLNEQGCDSIERYFETYYKNDTYSIDVWKSGFESEFSTTFLPAAEFTLQNWNEAAKARTLIPLMLKSYWENDMVVVLFLDVELIFHQDDAYLREGMYLFAEDGALLCTSDNAPRITGLPQEDSVTLETGEICKIVRSTSDNGMTYVKILPTVGSEGLLHTSFILCIVAATVSVVAVMILLLPTVKRTLQPVNKMLNLLHQHGQLQNPNDLHSAHNELENIIRSRDAQAAEIAQKDATLSQYFLRAKLKNVYVNMEEPQQWDEGNAYILYIQVQYRDTMRGYFSMTRAELENCLQEMLSGTLNQLFASTLIFQLEPGRFVAKVTMLREDTDIESRLSRFMKRLENEQEFACFTVIRSQELENGADLAAVYAQVQEAARHTRVIENGSQLVLLPLEAAQGEVSLTPGQEQQLIKLIQAGKTEETETLIREILTAQLQKGITHSQMEILCVTMVNKAAYAITELEPSAEKIAAASGVYNNLTTKCTTLREYCDAVTGFIRSATAANHVQPGDEDQLLRKVQQYLKDNYQREFSGEEMADALMVSRSYLSTYYKSKTGMNLSESIQLYRIQQAVELLRDPNVRIGDIGPRVGLPSSNTFLRQFKKYTGLTPKEYRLKEQR